MARITDSSATDLDETRRLLYMALLCGRTKRYNLAGTLVNAIRHHQDEFQVRLASASPGDGAALDELLNKAVAAVEGKPDGLTWAREQLERINALDT